MFFSGRSDARRVIATAFIIFLAVSVLGAAARVRSTTIVLPNGWVIREPRDVMTQTDTMPQGAAASRDGKTLAVVESGFNPATLRLYGTPDLDQVASIPLPGAFGRPAWLDPDHVLVAGANADALFDVDVAKQTVRTIQMAKNSYPDGVAVYGTTIAVATDGDGAIRLGALDEVASAKPVRVGGHIGGLAFSTAGDVLFASNRSSDYLEAIDTTTLDARRITTGLHPADILPVGNLIYVAASDGDSVDAYSPASGKAVEHIFVGDRAGHERLSGVSPNALAKQGDSIFVSLGAANSIAVIRSSRVVGRLDAGWYPTDVVPIGNRLFIVNGKGEGTRPNPHFDAKNSKSSYDYIASIQYGSIRTYDLSRREIGGGNPQGAASWQSVQPDPIVRSGGPIKHVFFVLKENRSYDQVFGDMREGNGDPKLTWFGAKVTPNEHALAARFGLFDNTYASGEVSESGHTWADAAFVNDYMERTWPASYGNRGPIDDTLLGSGVPRNGYIWQAARAAHVSFRDYGEMTDAPSLRGLYDRRYVGWDLNYGDLNRLAEWQREFKTYLQHGDVPQLEYIWLPNDHTMGSRVGGLTPVAYVATNDYAVGLLVAAISHSRIWRSSAIFIIEDDAQDGADHVSDQRTTLLVVSPYARGGFQHTHYSTVSVLRTMEIILGIKPLSTYDAMAVPLTAAFSRTPRLDAFLAIAPEVSMTARTKKTAYGAKVSAGLNFSRPDANAGNTLLRILAHNHEIEEPQDVPATH